MLKTLKLTFSFFVLVTLFSCSQNTEYLNKIQDPELFQEAMQNLTDIVVYDIFSPPVASRVYLYPSIAAYEIIARYNPEEFNSLVGQVKELQKIPTSNDIDINPQLAALFSFNAVGKALIFSEDKMEVFQEEFQQKLKSFKVPSQVVKASKTYGEEVASAILEWASGICTTRQEHFRNTQFEKKIAFGSPPLPTIWMELNPTGRKSGPWYWIRPTNSLPKIRYLLTLKKGVHFNNN